MTPITRRLVATALAALLVASLAAPALASTVASAIFLQGTGSTLAGGTLYARNGGRATLVVFTDAAQCVDVTGGITARRVAPGDQTTWSFPFTAGTGDGPRSVSITAWTGSSGTDCAGTAGTTATVAFVLDNTGPVVTAALGPVANGAGWNDGDVAITWSATDAGSGVASGPTPAAASQVDETPGTEHTATATDRLGNVGNGSVTVRLDGTAPTIGAVQEPLPNGAGWNRTDVTVTFSCEDPLSGIAACPDPVTVSGNTDGETVTGRGVDDAGNASTTATATVRIDREPPHVALVGGPADGATYTASTLPAEPTCDATDPRSGLAGDCTVEGYGATPGAHTITATAHDRAGNDATATIRYTVADDNPTAWVLEGFGRPVAMGDAVNVVKGGSTVPLKFEVFDGSTELTSPDVVAGFAVEDVGCTPARAGRGPVPFTATAGKDVRYDASDGRFQQHWKTPRTSGACYRVTVTTTDGSTLSAWFRTK